MLIEGQHVGGYLHVDSAMRCDARLPLDGRGRGQHVGGAHLDVGDACQHGALHIDACQHVGAYLRG